MTIDDASRSLPRILCLHGGGTSASIFAHQCRHIVSRLSSTFRFVFINSPFSSKPHPSIVPFFGSDGPFYRWLRWDDADPIDPDAGARIIDQCRLAMDGDAGDGPWVGIMGFSQGAKMAASLLWAQENGVFSMGERGRFAFGVLLAGRAPVVRLGPEGQLPSVPYTAGITEKSVDFTDWAPSNQGGHVVSVPTLHVHGLQDPGLDQQRYLLENYCKDGAARLIEWDGGHRVPKLSEDLDLVVREMLALAQEVGAVDSNGVLPASTV
jgi:hypothetical protein